MGSKSLIAGLLAFLPAAAGITLAWAHEATSKGVTVAHPWVRAAPEGATLSSAYLEIKTDKHTADRLVSVASPVAGRTEIHSETMEGGVMKLRPLDGLNLTPGESHVLKPSGEHIMLLDLKQPLKEGDLVELTLNFEKAGPIGMEATVEPAGALGPHGFDHQPVDDTMTEPMSHDEKSGEMHHHEHPQ
jgi:copper(I)-binding protein